MSIDVKLTRAALAASIGEITGLRYSSSSAGPIAGVGSCWVVGGASMQYDLAARRGLDKATVMAWVFVPRTTDRVAIDVLDGYLSSSGATSIKAAAESDKTLGGLVSDIRVTSAGTYETSDGNGTSYFVAEFSIDIYG